MKYIFDVPDMSCNHCKTVIEKQLKSSNIVSDYKVDLNNKKVEVETEESPKKIIELLNEAGYTAKLSS
ncbi:MAG TPA: heavy-metal-associated domain-containing protein [Defluviitoga sp.]|nr:heavy-metal-associated domain-containing protein [Defluviitoga sp.]HOP24286.1 heavy-metal-associated domain-containing protein [Defluviitoga sp.]HPZ28122.1 heavy-metal-associated domain-containing protein [Defluviitoga sp.]HQD62012.1 heavy-metal-associated domain-containing protein [Defluviitoga sp.]